MVSAGHNLTQISALVNLFGGLWWGSVLDIEEDKQFERPIKKGAEPQGGTTNCLKKQDALQAFICKCLLFSGRRLFQDLI